ncbi:Sec7 domain, alpha orthogonal bundle [Phytophthora cactorum]|nr:Sec7 domain, alpha orthogonal bundle [Phytophthora cactorum]
MTLVESLRHFLTNGGFRLPGEAQKIERMVEAFASVIGTTHHIKGSRVIPKATREASVSGADLENEKFRGGIAKAVAQSEELMKDLLHTYNTFQFVGVDTPISPDLIKILFERVWFSLLTLSTTILVTTSRICLQGCSASTCALLHLNVFVLNMPVERQALCGLLRKDSEEDPADKASKAIPEDTKYEWIRTIEAAAASDDPWKAMGDIHLLVNDMKETIQVRQKSEKLDSVIQRISLYRFFLFNDQLLYADKSMTGKWSPHNSLRLKLTRISNISDGFLLKNAFQIQNPVKAFVVFADSATSKAEWMRLIDDAIAEASKKINRTARRISAHGLGDTRASLVQSSAMKVFLRFSSPIADGESPVEVGAPSSTPNITASPSVENGTPANTDESIVTAATSADNAQANSKEEGQKLQSLTTKASTCIPNPLPQSLR